MINQLVSEINAALSHGLYLVALNSALTLPDICGKAEYPEIKSSSERYKKWYQEHVGQYEKSPDDPGGRFAYLSADLVCDLRCSMTHEGNPSIDGARHSIRKFRLIKNVGYMNGGCSTIYNDDPSQRELDVGIANLCFKLCTTAQHYYEENKDKFKFNYTLADWPC